MKPTTQNRFSMRSILMVLFRLPDVLAISLDYNAYSSHSMEKPRDYSNNLWRFQRQRLSGK